MPVIDAIARAAFSMLAASTTVRRLASRVGMRRPAGFARRFVAGETLDEAVEAARGLEARGLLVTLDHLGESVASIEAATAAAETYVRMIGELRAAGICRNLSIKLTQLGLDVDRATAIDNVRRVLDAGGDFFVRIDMEGSAHTDPTIEVFERLWGIGYRNVGMVLQSALRRTPRDLDRLLAMGARVRLVKGAYREPKAIAFQQKAEVDAAFVSLAERLLRDGDYPGFATHDEAMIAAVQASAAAQGIGKDKYEFQMLYGVRRDLHASLAAAGHPFRVYVPFGREWFPYFMRRLGERPANVAFVLRSLRKEGKGA